MSKEYLNELSTTDSDALEKLRNGRFDILHIHGCWHYSLRRVARQALDLGCRLLVTPHGQLEPWVMAKDYWKEKLPKRILFQKQVIQSAYAIVVQGKMEEEGLSKLRWNQRTTIIRNSLITQTITAEQMAGQMVGLYRKVMDSNPLELMTDDTRHTLRQIIKAGITGDSRWLREQCLTISDPDQWRMVFNYAHQEAIENTVTKGLQTLQLHAPDIDVSQAPYFVPDDYQAPSTIERVIGMHFSTENERLLATFRYLRKLSFRRQLTISHLVELDKELREHDAVEDKLCDSLQERHMLSFAARLMQLMHDMTGLDEGYMPMPPVNDFTTRKMKKQIKNHLKL